MKACKRCHMLTENNVCAFCNSPTSDQWQGYVVIIDPQRSRNLLDDQPVRRRKAVTVQLKLVGKRRRGGEKNQQASKDPHLQTPHDWLLE